MAASDLEHARILSSDLHLDTDLDRFQSFSAGSACPSLASSFVSYGSSPTNVHAHRRASGSQSDSSVGLSHSTSRTSLSPMTPFSAGMLDIAMPAPTIGCGQPELLVPGGFHCNEPASDNLGYQWLSQEPKEPPVDESALISATHPYMRSSHDYYLSSDQGLAAGAALDSSLSRSIFHHRQLSDDQISQLNHWRPSMLHSSPRTVVPSATFQPILPSSPGYHLTPSTPIQSQVDLTSRLDSSPFTSPPAYAPSDASLFLPSDDRIIQPTLVRTMRETRRPMRGRKANKPRKDDPSRPSRLSKSTAASGYSMSKYPSVIAQNSFECQAEGCVDKYGHPKRFKRQEHLKRHQRTCHTGSRPHYCWVPECKTAPFSRTDNLNSHLLKTHGKNSPAARNRYIATLDPKSGVFDINYRGPFKKDGWPGVDDED